MLRGPDSVEIEVGPIPGLVRARAFAPIAAAQGAAAPKALGVVNAPPLLVELQRNNFV